MIHDISEMNRIEPGDVLVTDMTDPDWEPIMKKPRRLSPTAAGVPVTRRLSPVSWGSRRWSAAVMLPIAFRKIRMSPSPAPKATPLCLRRAARLQRQELQRRRHAGSAAEGDDERRQPGSRVRLRLPAERRRRSGAAGIYHQPYDWRSSRALLEFDDQEPGLQNEIRELMKGYDSPREFYVGRLTEGSPPSAPLSIRNG